MWTQEQKKEHEREWRKNNPEKIKASREKWREANRERINANKRAWYVRNKEKANATVKEWRSNNKDKITEMRKRYEMSLSPDKKELLKAGCAARAKKRGRERKIRVVEFLGGKCKSCGLVDCPAVYDFHHRDPSTKEFSIAKLCGRPWNKILEAELQKCDLLCANCHRKVHYIDEF